MDLTREDVNDIVDEMHEKIEDEEYEAAKQLDKVVKHKKDLLDNEVEVSESGPASVNISMELAEAYEEKMEEDEQAS